MYQKDFLVGLMGGAIAVILGVYLANPKGLLGCEEGVFVLLAAEKTEGSE